MYLATGPNYQSTQPHFYPPVQPPPYAYSPQKVPPPVFYTPLPSIEIGQVEAYDIRTIQKEHNIGRLESTVKHFCMKSVTRQWFEAESSNNKALLLQLFQASVSHSQYSLAYRKEVIEELAEENKRLVEQVREKKKIVDNKKETLYELKHEYDVKKEALKQYRQLLQKMHFCTKCKRKVRNKLSHDRKHAEEDLAKAEAAAREQSNNTASTLMKQLMKQQEQLLKKLAEQQQKNMQMMMKNGIPNNDTNNNRSASQANTPAVVIGSAQGPTNSTIVKMLQQIREIKLKVEQIDNNSRQNQTQPQRSGQRWNGAANDTQSKNNNNNASFNTPGFASESPDHHELKRKDSRNSMTKPPVLSNINLASKDLNNINMSPVQKTNSRVKQMQYKESDRSEEQSDILGSAEFEFPAKDEKTQNKAQEPSQLKLGSSLIIPPKNTNLRNIQPPKMVPYIRPPSKNKEFQEDEYSKKQREGLQSNYNDNYIDSMLADLPGVSNYRGKPAGSRLNGSSQDKKSASRSNSKLESEKDFDGGGLPDNIGEVTVLRRPENGPRVINSETDEQEDENLGFGKQAPKNEQGSSMKVSQIIRRDTYNKDSEEDLIIDAMDLPISDVAPPKTNGLQKKLSSQENRKDSQSLSKQEQMISQLTERDPNKESELKPSNKLQHRYFINQTIPQKLVKQLFEDDLTDSVPLVNRNYNGSLPPVQGGLFDTMNHSDMMNTNEGSKLPGIASNLILDSVVQSKGTVSDELPEAGSGRLFQSVIEKSTGPKNQGSSRGGTEQVVNQGSRTLRRELSQIKEDSEETSSKNNLSRQNSRLQQRGTTENLPGKSNEQLLQTVTKQEIEEEIVRPHSQQERQYMLKAEAQKGAKDSFDRIMKLKAEKLEFKNIDKTRIKNVLDSLPEEMWKSNQLICKHQSIESNTIKQDIIAILGATSEAKREHEKLLQGNRSKKPPANLETSLFDLSKSEIKQSIDFKFEPQLGNSSNALSNNNNRGLSQNNTIREEIVGDNNYNTKNSREESVLKNNPMSKYVREQTSEANKKIDGLKGEIKKWDIDDPLALLSQEKVNEKLGNHKDEVESEEYEDDFEAE